MSHNVEIPGDFLEVARAVDERLDAAWQSHIQALPQSERQGVGEVSISSISAKLAQPQKPPADGKRTEHNYFVEVHYRMATHGHLGQRHTMCYDVTVFMDHDLQVWCLQSLEPKGTPKFD